MSEASPYGDGRRPPTGQIALQEPRQLPLRFTLKIGYARVSTTGQDLTAQRDALTRFGVEADRIYVDHGLTGTNRARPGLREAMAACRAGDVLVVTKLDRQLPKCRTSCETGSIGSTSKMEEPIHRQCSRCHAGSDLNDRIEAERRSIATRPSWSPSGTSSGMTASLRL